MARPTPVLSHALVPRVIQTTALSWEVTSTVVSNAGNEVRLPGFASQLSHSGAVPQCPQL